MVPRGKGGKGRVGAVRARGRARDRPLLRLRRATASPGALTCGSETAASASPTTRCTRLWASAPMPLASSGFHPHRLRHTAAHRWLAAGGSESGLMAVAGWTRPDMLMRYTKAQASARAPKKPAS